VPAIGIDLSVKALLNARQSAPDVGLVASDVCGLPFPARSCAGAIAFYCLHHLPRSGLAAALQELHRVLKPDGVLVIATHLGEGEVYSGTEWMGHQIDPMGGTLYTVADLEQQLAAASFIVETSLTRDPLPDEYQGRRIYLQARVRQ
jgi:SAM-dependent methyltransferase